MANEIKTITATLKSVAQEAKRTVFAFQNPDGGDYDFKASAFEPHVPKLKIGTEYTFECEFKPMKDDPAKFYKNLFRTRKDGPYKIQESDPCQPAPMGEDEPSPSLTKVAIKAPPHQTSASAPQSILKTEYDDKQARKELSIIRQSSIKAAAEIIAGFAQAGTMQNAWQASIAAQHLAEDFVRFVETGKPMQTREKEVAEPPTVLQEMKKVSD